MTAAKNRFAEMAEWWLAESRAEITATIPKMVEYGSEDLEQMGQTLLGMVKDAQGSADADEDQAFEIGVWFYVLGKVARWTAAVKAGKPVSADTLRDIAVYVKMVQGRRYETRQQPVQPEPEQEEQA